MSTEQNNHGLSFSWDKSKNENISTATSITFQYSFSKRSISVQGDLFGICSHQMIDYVAARSVASSIAKPLFSSITVNYTCWIMNSTV
uniref:Uncharacterized protein n=1 Tax=Arion vulgaris TaxID=1028688 RepID=A0A0B7B481_9EUPU